MPNYQRFKVIKLLGAGAFGKTLLVEDRKRKNGQVVLKVPHDKNREEALIRELMNNTALRASLEGISHENIVQLIDFALFEDFYVIILEYVEGSDLSARLGPLMSERPALGIQEAIELFDQVCAGLSAAHHAGLVHRDIKPANILVREADGVVKLADFGISKILESSSSGAAAGTVIGTPYYMSPEAWSGRADAQSDIWSLSVMLYQMLTGQLPFWAENVIELKEKIDREQPIPPRKLNSEIDEKLELAVLKGLEKDISKRFKTVDAIRAAIRPQDLENQIAAALRLVEDGKENMAVQQLLKLEKKYPRQPRIYLTIGQIYSRMDQFPEAEQILRRGLSACTDHAALYLSLAMALSKLGREKRAEAVQAMEQAVRLGLNESQARSARALLKQWQAAGGAS